MSGGIGSVGSGRIRNEYNRGTAQVRQFADKVGEVRLRCFGHVRRRGDGYTGRRMLTMELPGKRKGGRPKRRFVAVTVVRTCRLLARGTGRYGKRLSAVANPK